MPRMLKTVAYDINDVVYHRCVADRQPGIVISITFLPGGAVIYTVCWGPGQETGCYESELSSEWCPDFSDNSTRSSHVTE